MNMRRIAPLAIGTFAIGTDNFIVAGILGGMADDLGVSLAAAGLQVTVFSLVYALGSPLLSALTQQAERRAILVGSMGLFALANVLTAIAPTFGVLLATRIVAAVAAGVFGPVATAAAAEQSEPEFRGRAISIVTGGLTVSIVLGVPIGVLISALSDWRGAFWFVAALALVAAVSTAAALPRLPGTPGPGIAERFRPMLRPAVGLTLLQSVTVVGSTFIVFTYLATLVHGTGVGGDGEFATTLIMLVFGVAAVFGNIIGGRSADRVGGTTTIRRTIVVLTLALAAVSLVAQTLDGMTAYVALAAVVAVWGVSGWAFTPAQFSRLAQIDPAHMHLTFALNNSAIYIGSALGASIGGGIVEWASAGGLGWVAAGGEVIGFLLVLLAVARPRLGVPAAPPAAPSADEPGLQPAAER
ncbi:MFS transporter [Streptomyces sp. NPDC058157]|uniref:MFS transporter n=1 Tax=Streptomyces sp. NPDC058157 TaxID=3346360 RepID=UPI0036E9A236